MSIDCGARRHTDPVIFFALWPDAETRARLAEMALAAAHRSGGRATSAEKLHLTLVYLGPTSPEVLEAVRRAASALRADPFSLVLDQLGWWRHNRIAWLGASRMPPALSSLQAELHARVGAAGATLDTRAYVPHITLVRKANQGLSQESVPPLVWRAEHFCLAQSASSRYLVLDSWPLGEKAGQ
jgi:2'-5' RNA ligase